MLRSIIGAPCGTPWWCRWAANSSQTTSLLVCGHRSLKRSVSSASKAAPSRRWRRAKTSSRSSGIGARQPRAIAQTVLSGHRPAARRRNRSSCAKRNPQCRLRKASWSRSYPGRRRCDVARFCGTCRGDSGHARSYRNGFRLLSNPCLENMPQLAGAEFATVTGLVLYGERRRKTHDFHENSNSGLKKFVAKFRSFL